MPHKTDIAGETYGDIDEEEYSRGTVFRVMSGTKFQEYIGKYCHRETTYPDGVSAREKEERDPDEDSIEDKEEDKPAPSYESLHLIPENIEEKTVGEKVKCSAVEKLVEEKLNSDLEIESLH